MTAPGITLAQSRADDERRRAARTARIAERHEQWSDEDQVLRALHLRMAAIHRQVQRQHLTAAALHAALAGRVRTWAQSPGGGTNVSRQAPRPPVDDPSPSPGPLALGARAHRLLVMLVETLDVHADVDRFLSEFATGCAALLDVTAGSILITDHSGRLGIGGWSSEPARLFAGAELRGGEGPSVECHLTGGNHAYPSIPVLATRWPHLASTAVTADISAVYVVPLRRRDDTFGVLTLVDRRPGRVSDEMLRPVGVLAVAAATGLAHRRAINDLQRVRIQLQSALTSRVAIEQAKGMLAERLHIPVDSAFDLLRGHARSHNRNLHEVAAAIADRSLDIDLPEAARKVLEPRNRPGRRSRPS